MPSTVTGSLVTFWKQDTYGVSQYGTPESETVGVSRLDPATGAETKLYSEAVAGYPYTGTGTAPLFMHLAVRPDGGPLVFGNRVILVGPASGFSGFGTPGGPNYRAPQQDRSRLVSVDVTTGAAKVLSTDQRQVSGVGATDDGQLLVDW